MSRLMRYGCSFSMLALLLGSLLAPAQASNKGSQPSVAAANQVRFINVSTGSSDLGGSGASPLTRILFGIDNSFQVLNSQVSTTNHQFYPSGQESPADMGVFVRYNGTLYGPDFAAHGPVGTATGSLGAYTRWDTLSLVADPAPVPPNDKWRVTGTSRAGADLNLTHVVTYRNNESFFRHTLTFTNKSESVINFDVFLAGDLYLRDSDSGRPFGTPPADYTVAGGRDCNAGGTYQLFFTPITGNTAGTGAQHISAGGYTSIWSQIGSGGNLDDAIATGCIDNGAGLQWTRSLGPGSSVTVEAATSFGPVGLPGLTVWGVLALSTILGTSGLLMILRRRRTAFGV